MGHRKKRRNELLRKIQEIETGRKKAVTKEDRINLQKLREEYLEIKMSEARSALVRGRRSFYAHGNKSSRGLARSLRVQGSRTFVPLIKRKDGSRTALSREIAEEFKNDYKELYNISKDQEGEEERKRENIINYLKESGLMRFEDSWVTELEKPITLEKFRQALSGTSNGKAPGPDGFTAKYYKLYTEILGPRFIQAFNTIRDGAHIPHNSLRAIISVIPKEGKDNSDCAIYRPIALLNSDVKLYSKMPRFINLDQAGFTSCREAWDNTTRVIDLVHQRGNIREPSLLLATDAEKALDRVDWVFIEETLRFIGLGDMFMKYILYLYKSPSAEVIINGITSEQFGMSNGTRQGCPLSPIIFILTMEPFLGRIRLNPSIEGITVGKTPHKVAAYADDLIFFVKKTQISLPNLQKEFFLYNRVSNYTINVVNIGWQ